MATERPGHADRAVQKVIDALERSLTSRSDPGSGWFASAMRGLLDIAVADANGTGPAPEELERLWDAVHRMAVDRPEKLHSFAWQTENAALSVRNHGWDEAWGPSTLSFRTHGWTEASWRRSVLELMRRSPRFAGYGEPLTDDDMATIDDPLKEAAQDVEPLDPGQIPEGIPTTHWWWWAPSAH